MSLYTIRSLADASLFCPQSSILATFYLDSPDAALLNHHNDTVMRLANAQLSEIGIHLLLDNSKDETSLPVFIQLITALTEEMMKRGDLDCRKPISTRDKSQKKVFVAFAEKNRTLTLHVLKQATRFVLGLYYQEEQKLPRSTSAHLPGLRYLLDNYSALGKNREIKDIQRCLMTENKPWLSLDFTRENNNWIQIGFGRQQKVLNGTVSFDTSFLGVSTSLSKMKTQEFLSQLGFSVTRQVVVKTAAHACQQALQIGYPIVLKSDVGTHGSLVYADLRSPEEVSERFHILKENLSKKIINAPILIEDFVPGRVYRVEVINEKFFDAYHMIPAGITGDGKHTIEALVEIENQQPTRKNKADPSATYVTLQLGTSELLMLKKQGLSVGNIPAKDEYITLSANSNWSAGGTFRKVTEHVHKDNQALAERVAAAFKIDLLGIDIITNDIGKSFLDENLTIIEVNHTPGMGSYYDDEINKHVEFGDRAIDQLLPNIIYGDVPIIMFKASQLAGESEVLFSHTLNKLGYSAGLVNEEGLVINGQVWAKPEHVDYQNPGLQLLRNNAVGAAIIDQKPAALADFGLGSGGCDIAVILNCQHKQITTPVWPLGISTKKTDRLLSQSARLASIVFVDNSEGIELCMHQSEKIFALFTANIAEAEALLELGINYIKLECRTEEGISLRITYNENNYEKWLRISTSINPLPYLAMLASLLVLGFDIDKSIAMLENQ